MDAHQNGCPDCGSPLGTAPGPHCRRCGLPLTGPQAVELWQLDRALADLSARRAGLLARRGVLLAALRARSVRTAPGGAATGPLAAGPLAVGVGGGGQLGGVPWGAPRPDAPSPSVQTVLLVLGGVLTSVAGLVFTLVNWGHLGVAGRAAVLAAVTALAFAAHRALRPRLAATAETAAAIGVALVLLDFHAARAADLAGLAGVPGDAYGTLVTALTGAASWAYGQATRSTVLRAGALLLAQCTVPFAAATFGHGSAGWGTVFVAGAALDLSLALTLHRAARPLPVPARATAAAAAVWAAAVWAVVGGAVAGTAVLAAGPQSAYPPVLRACLPLVLLVLLAGLAARRPELPRPARVVAGALAGAALVAAAAAAPRIALPASWTVAAHAVPAAVLAVAALRRLEPPGTVTRREPLAAGAASAGAAVLGVALLQVLPDLLRALGEPLRQTVSGAQDTTERWHVAAQTPAVAGLVALVATTVALLLAAGRHGANSPSPTGRSGQAAGRPATDRDAAGSASSGASGGGDDANAPSGGPASGSAPAADHPADAPHRGPAAAASAGPHARPGAHAQADPHNQPGRSHAQPGPSVAAGASAGPGRPGQPWQGAWTPQPAAEAGYFAWCAAVVAAVLSAVVALALTPVAAGLPYGAALAAAWLPALVAAVVLARRPDADLVPRVCAVVAPAALALLWSLPHDTAALIVWGATATLCAGLAAALRGSAARWIADGAAACTLAALGVEAARAAAVAELPPHLAAFAVMGVAVAGLPVAARLRGAAFEATGYAAGAAAVLMTVPHRDAASVALAVAGVAALGVALRADRRGPAAVTATALLAGASWLRLAAAGVTAPEPYTVPVAVAALVLGNLRRRRFPQTGSWPAYGPGLGLALLPALGAAWADADWLRPLLLGVAALAVTLAGARHRLRAPLLLGGAVLTADAVHELAPAIAQSLGLVPRWAPLAAVGLLLLFLGATYEQRLADGRRLRDHLRRLT
ncbi:hypothetical protein SAMN05216267_101385 [Actinacidiphila rubida]|uniref:Uncharacterized protein n=1 Tax=Actinacidiphila rubida TaxID=310780 RepID=A0A1H8KLS7_9ACTN|nr:hypothetical protein [Actinacidiphila rubida]SEN93903.1 hypothetical protein SAMN05216267_101385 [Actinacidiphila rubida]